MPNSTTASGGCSASCAIESISTDPAYAPRMRAAAELLAKDLAGLGFDASLRPTGGHPIGASPNGAATANGKAPHVLFYGHYDVQPVDPLSLWETPPFEPRMRRRADGQGASWRAAPATTKAR